MPKERRRVINRLVQLACAEISQEMLKELEAEKPRMWVKKWVARREELRASNNLLKEMALEDAGVYRNVLRIGLEKFEESLSMITPKIGKKVL